MNLMLTNYCNSTACPYCFGQEEMHSKAATNISLENFKKYLIWLKNEECHEVRLLGGEPTLHPQLEEIIDMVIDFDYFNEILFFSNLIFDHKIAELFVEKNKKIRISILPNINELSLLLPNARKKVEDNLDYLSTNLPFFDRIGINIYKPDQDLSKWENLICKYNMNSVRFNIVVPNVKLEEEFNFYQYFHSFQPLLKEIAEWGEKYKVYATNDCNPIPLCCFDDDLIKYILAINPSFFGSFYCNGSVLDVNPDLEVRCCFGENSLPHVNLLDYKNEWELSEYFKTLTKYKKQHYIAWEKCVDCPKRKTLGQSCACSAYLLHYKRNLNEEKDKKEIILNG